MFLLLLIPELVKRTRKRELLFFSNSSRNYNEKLNCKLKKIIIIIIIIEKLNEESFFVPSFPLRAEETDRSKKRAQLTFRKAQQHAKESRIKGYRASVKKGGPPRSSSILERDKSTPTSRPSRSLLRAVPDHVPRNAALRKNEEHEDDGDDYLPALSLPPSSYLETRRIDACTCASRSSTKDTKRSGARRFYANLCGPKSLGRRRQPT